MKKYRFLSVFIALALVVAMLPTFAAAANTSGDQILTSFGVDHTSIVKLDEDTTRFSLPVLPSYTTSTSKSISLVDGVTRTYDTTKYKSVVITPSTSSSYIGKSVTLTVSYQKVGDSSGNTFTTSYTVNIVQGDDEPADFSGTIDLKVPIGTAASLTFDEFNDFFDARSSSADLYGIAINGSSIAGITLKTASGNYTMGKMVSAANIKNLAVSAAIDAKPGSEVTFTVTGYTAASKPIENSSVTLNVTVVADTQPDFPLSVLTGYAVELPENTLYSACRTITGNPLSYLYIDSISDPDCGTLYSTYNAAKKTGTEADFNTKYYFSGSDRDLISNLTFVSEQSGETLIGYTAYDTEGNHFTGTINLVVGYSFTLDYSVAAGKTLALSASEIDRAFSDTLSANLSYVTFAALPDSDDAKLTYHYGLSTSSDVTVDDKYYRAASGNQLALDRITFVPRAGFSGTVMLKLACVSDSRSAVGFLIIKVGSDAAVSTDKPDNNTAEIPEVDLAPKYLSTGDAVPLDLADLNDACQAALGTALSYVRFALPSTDVGTLYYNRTAATSYTSKVSAVQYYNVNGNPALGKISFLPRANYTGAVSISYLGYDQNDKSFSGTIAITVTHDTVSNNFSDVTASYAWAVPAVDFLCENAITNGTSAGKYSPAGTISRGDYLLMLYRACNLSALQSTIAAPGYTDVKDTDYYYTAIAAGKALNILTDTAAAFRPTEAITREDAMVYSQRALAAIGLTLPTGTAEDLSAFSDVSEISPDAVGVIASLVKAGVINGASGKISPQSTMTRAEMAVVLYRILTLGI
ncbi:MAG: S-layer homology domain-containing protein [Oscillospiraceae bacterium]|nr:S-layer homology domain-containing protein [Oscillospiraceae bacterium]